MSGIRPIPEPAIESGQGHLPGALTFYVSQQQRAKILKALKGFDSDRVLAILEVLKLSVNESKCIEGNKGDSDE